MQIFVLDFIKQLINIVNGYENVFSTESIVIKSLCTVVGILLRCKKITS